MPDRHHSDPLFRISYGIFSVKFVVFELVFFGLGLYGLYTLVQDETGFTFASPPSTDSSEPAPVRPSPATPTRPQ